MLSSTYIVINFTASSIEEVHVNVQISYVHVYTYPFIAVPPSLPPPSPPTPLPPPPLLLVEQDKDKKRRATHKWDAVEIANFERGIAECGVGNWKDILVGYKFQPGRTNVDLKDKYRNMKGRNKKRHRIG